MWLIGVVVCLLAADRMSICSRMRAMDGCIVCCSIISSCQSAATSKIVKCFWPCVSSVRITSCYSMSCTLSCFTKITDAVMVVLWLCGV